MALRDREMHDADAPLLSEERPSARRPIHHVVALGAAATCALAVAGLCVAELGGAGSSGERKTVLLGARQQQLAYDGPYDTPPVTWYFPASNNQNTLGYTWNEAQMQTPTVTYGPGVPTNNGIAYTTADTVGYDFGDVTSAYPMGGNADYQSTTTWANVGDKPQSDLIYQYTGYKTGNARRGRSQGLKGGARAQSLADIESSAALNRAMVQEDAGGVVGGLAAKLRSLEFGGQDLEAKIALEGAAVDSLARTRTASMDKDAKKLSARIHKEQATLAAIEKVRGPGKKIAEASNDDGLGPAAWPGVKYVNDAAHVLSHLEPVGGRLGQQALMAHGMSEIMSQFGGPSLEGKGGTEDMSGGHGSDAVTYCTQRVCNNVFVFGNVNLGTGETYETRPEVLGALGPEWDYAGVTTGPGNWSVMSRSWRACGRGRAQSPINLELSIRPDRFLRMLRWSGPTSPYEASLVGPLYANVFTLTRLRGHMTVSGLKMELRNMTIHTPSEHAVAGKHHHGELQFHHTAEVDSSEVTLIVSAFLEIADTTAPFLRSTMATARGFAYTYNPDAINGLGYDNPAYQPDVMPSSWFSTSDLAEGVLGWGANYANYETYSGSLSQPPCTEGVTRIVVKKSVPITAGDLAAISALQGRTNRPTQPLYGRAVYEALSHPAGQ